MSVQATFTASLPNPGSPPACRVAVPQSCTLRSVAAAHAGPAALLHVDCDLYSSTRCIFASLGSRVVPGSILVFDEYFDYPGWEEHECRAFAEFVAEVGLSYEYLAYNRLHEQVAVQAPVPPPPWSVVPQGEGGDVDGDGD